MEAEGAGFTALVFNLAGPTVIVTGAALQAGMPPGQLAEMLAFSFLISGLVTVWLSVRHRQPYALIFSMTGALGWLAQYGHYSPGVVAAALLVTGAILLALGWTEFTAALQRRVPAPIMLGVFAGMLFPLLQIGIRGIVADPVPGLALVVTLLMVRRTTALKRWVPPAVAAAVVALVWLFLAGPPATAFPPLPGLRLTPVLPIWELRSVAELSLTFLLCAILIQNSQGLALMTINGFRPDPNLVQRWSGLGGMSVAVGLGLTPVMAAPITGIVAAPTAGRLQRRWVASFTLGVCWLALVPVVPLLVRLLLRFPPGILALLGGLAVVDPLVHMLKTAFSGPARLGALAAFAVSLSGVNYMGFSAPVLGTVAGLMVNWLEGGTSVDPWS